MAKQGKLILTASSMATLFSCARKYYLAYEQGWRKIRADEALRMGTGMHKGLEARANGKDYFSARKDVLDAVGSEEVDAMMLATINALLAGYYKRYEGDGAEMKIEPEKEFAVKFKFMRNVVVCGKMDGIIKFADGRTGIIEHKTTAQDISPDSEYWQGINKDQIALYKAAFEKDGKALDEVIYDVIKKPGMKPYKATPVEKRKYKADGTLYANCREQDETADEWMVRLSEDVAARMDEYYARRTIPLLSSDMDRLARRLFIAVKLIKGYRKLERVIGDDGGTAIEAWPKGGSSMVCKGCAFRGLCDYGEMPQGEWERGRAHEELEIVGRL